MYRIMLVDDEENILNSLNRALRKQRDWEIETYDKPTEALKRARTTSFDLFLSDFRMPDMNGVQFLTEIRELQPESMRLILSGYTDLEALVGAINQAEIYRFITKPWQDLEVIATIGQALQFRDILVENRRLADQVMNSIDQRLSLVRLEYCCQQLLQIMTQPGESTPGQITLNQLQLNRQHFTHARCLGRPAGLPALAPFVDSQLQLRHRHFIVGLIDYAW